MEHEAMWVSYDEKVFEHLRLLITNDSVTADGWIIQLGERSNRIQYRINCDVGWRVRKLEMTRWGQDDQDLLLHSDGQGHWTSEDYEAIPSLNGCIDLDIYASPFTNTLPIRRLKLQPQQSEIIKVAFIELPDLKVTAVQQRYTLLTSKTDGSALYGFEGLDSGFKTELPVDALGLVTEYPKFFYRLH